MRGDRRRTVQDEGGQVLAFAVVVMVVLIGLTGFALDVGHAYLVQRQLQSATDAAALAGALELPSTSAAIQTAKDYGPEPGKRNALRSSDNATIDVQPRCVTAINTGCDASTGNVNSISVATSSNVPTIFAKVLGFDSFTVHATATACSPCSVKPIDIMIVLDRTGSMCQFSDRSPDPACTDLANARNGIETFLRAMNPRFHRVGLAVLPPSTGTTRNAQCSPPSVPDAANYDSPSASYLMVPLSSDYAASTGVLNHGSTLVDRVECQQKGGGRTGYANAIDAAQAELDARGRADAKKVIVFLSDGAANYGPSSSPASYRTQPCHAGVRSAASAKAKSTVVYSIGYDLDGINGVYERCQTRSNGNEVPAMNALEAMEQIASSNETFYNKPTPGQLNTIFATIAADIFKTAQLIADSLS